MPLHRYHPAMQLALEIVALLLGFIFLAKGSDWLVGGGSTLAGRMGIRPLVVGLTVVAWGTSAPEMVVSGLAAIDGKIEFTMGNVLGSNVANIGLVLGVSGMILPEVLHTRHGWRESIWLLLSVGLFWFVTWDLAVTRTDGAILLGALGVYNLQLLMEARQSTGGLPGEPLPVGAGWFEQRPGFATLFGALTIAVAAWGTIYGAERLAGRAGISESVVALSVLAIGTSLPELAAGVAGALKGQSDISLGNVVGSNVLNVLGVIGVVALIHPFGGPGDPQTQASLQRNLDVDFPIVLGFSIAALLLGSVGGARGGRLKGFFLLAAYLAYMGLLFLSSAE